jgi:hypothetical protein
MLLHGSLRKSRATCAACGSIEPTKEERFMARRLPYQTPKMETLGTVHEMTLMPKFNKVGPDSDVYSNAIPIVGSIKPI